MTLHRAYVGIGTNLGDRFGNVEAAITALSRVGKVLTRSSLYRTAPWGKRHQPWFLNAVVAIETKLEPVALLPKLKQIEEALGRVPGERWGPRVIDLDLLLYDDLHVATPGLQVPHPHLRERAFVLVPLAEIEPRFAPLRDALDRRELAGVVRAERESAPAMPEEERSPAARVRALARFLDESGTSRVRIVRDDDEIVLRVDPRRVLAPAPAEESRNEIGGAQRIDTIRADIVGIFRAGRPAPVEGDVLEGDRELGYIEALGIRTPVHSMGAGRLLSVSASDGAPVEYGQPLFTVARIR